MQRNAWHQLAEKLTCEADEYVNQKRAEQRQVVKMIHIQTTYAFDEDVQAKRKRGLRSHFREGMHENHLQELKSRLNRLNSDTQAYFGA